MKVNKIRARAAKYLCIANRLPDHKMNVNQHIGRLAKRFQHGNADRNVGDEASVHHIKVNIVRSAKTDILHLGAQF